MDKQTAIDLLDNLLGMVEDNHGSDYDKAIHMGIDALKSNAPNALSALDCVERQAAVDAIRAKDDYSNVAVAIGLGKAITAICELPSVQPEKQETFPVDGEPLDCISRQQAILAIERNAYRREDINETEHIIKWVLDIIKWLPSVQPQQVTGKLDESCTDCPLYDNDAHNCPRFNKVIPRVLEEQQVTDKLNGVPSVQPQRWIPVSAALPEHSGFYIVTAIVTDDGGKLVGLRWFSQEHGWKFGKNPLAWMPLPPSYKEDEDARN